MPSRLGSSFLTFRYRDDPDLVARQRRADREAELLTAEVIIIGGAELFLEVTLDDDER